jgi:ribulose-phosphate 3-epimerase
MVVPMTVNPGLGGRKFIQSGVETTRRLRQMVGEREVHIQIDGGVTPETPTLVVKARG